MRLNPTARQVNQQGGHEHLADGDGVAGEGPARSRQAEQDGKTRDRATQKDGRPDMKMDLALNS